jgi:acyl-CoA reductase-like NAD-dependent aldehyde dehydrogenase
MNIQNYINGHYENPIQNEWLDNYCPANGEVYGQIPNSSKADVENAFIAAKAAFPSWSQTTLEARSRILIKISELIEANLQRFAHAESKDNGKPISLATKVLGKTLSITRYGNRLAWLVVFLHGTSRSICLPGKLLLPLLQVIV